MKAKKEIKKITKDAKSRTNLTIRESFKQMGIDKAWKKRVSLSELVELAIFDYNAE